MPDRGTAAATNRSERTRKVRPETVIFVGGALGLAAGMGLVSGVEWATSSGCFRSGMAWGGPVAGYLRSGALIASMIGLFVSLIILWSAATNEVMHRFTVRLCWMSLLTVLLVAASYSLAGVMGCVAL